MSVHVARPEKTEASASLAAGAVEAPATATRRVVARTTTSARTDSTVRVTCEGSVNPHLTGRGPGVEPLPSSFVTAPAIRRHRPTRGTPAASLHVRAPSAPARSCDLPSELPLPPIALPWPPRSPTDS